MNNKSKVSIFSLFVLKSVLAASLIMFLCMAIGELFYDKNLFSGFLHRPTLWTAIFFETGVATILMTTIGALVLYQFRDKTKKQFLSVAALTWLLLDVLLISAYSYFYWTRDWHITKIAPGLIFGWILPGTLFTTYLIYSSFDLKEAN